MSVCIHHLIYANTISIKPFNQSSMGTYSVKISRVGLIPSTDNGLVKTKLFLHRLRIDIVEGGRKLIWIGDVRTIDLQCIRGVPWWSKVRT